MASTTVHLADAIDRNLLKRARVVAAKSEIERHTIQNDRAFSRIPFHKTPVG